VVALLFGPVAEIGGGGFARQLLCNETWCIRPGRARQE